MCKRVQIDIMKACFGFSVCQLVANYFELSDQLTLIRFETRLRYCTNWWWFVGSEQRDDNDDDDDRHLDKKKFVQPPQFTSLSSYKRDDFSVWQIEIALTAFFVGDFRWFGRRYSMHSETEQGDQQHKFHC